MPELPKSRSELNQIHEKQHMVFSEKKYQLDLLKKFKETLKNVDSSKIDESTSGEMKVEVTDRQQEFIWIRIFLREEVKELEIGDIISIHYLPSGEKLDVHFGAYEKVGLNKDHDDEVINFVTEEDKTILCCMIDLDILNRNPSDIPTVRTFFRSSRHFYPSLLRIDEIDISCSDKNIDIDYFNINF